MTPPDWTAVLHAIAPHGAPWIVKGTISTLPRMIVEGQLSTLLRQAHFLAQVAHESAGFATVVEYASGVEYQGRGDLGNTHPGDGMRFKGRGLIQLTGRTNYGIYGHRLNLPLVDDPGIAATFPAAGLIAAAFWTLNGCNTFADRDDLEGVTHKINGGLKGLSDRALYLRAAKKALGV